MNNPFFARFVLLGIASLFSICCEKTPVNPPVDDTFYQQLILAYEEDLSFTSIVKGQERTVIEFNNGTVVDIPVSAINVYDCREIAPAKVTLEERTNTWKVGALDTGVAKTDEKDRKRCQPVYIYYTGSGLCMHISNGELLEYRINVLSENPLYGFCFTVKHNPSLTRDISCYVQNGEITGILPRNLTDFNLIPSFTFTGAELTVDGVAQKSGRNSHDFSREVVYTAKLNDGTVKTYSVSMEKFRTLPVVYLTTEGGAPILDKENYVPGTVVFSDPESMYSEVTELECGMGIRGRGNTTWGFEKKPWRLKLSEKSEVYGMPKSKNWALLANYTDKTLVRNLAVMEMSRILGMEWTPEMKSVEVYLNNAYQGCYVISQHKEVASGKVDIDIVKAKDIEGEALTGGYYFEIDGSQDEECCWWTKVGIPIMVSEPASPTVEQEAYVKKLFSDFETALYAQDFDDPQKGYAAFIDIDSFIRNFIIQELTKNVDGNLRKSTFITKKRGDKMHMYHVWDFDIALGNCNYFPDFWPGVNNGPEGWFVKNFINASKPSDGWYGKMFKDPKFKERAKQIWNEVKPELENIPQYIDCCAAVIDDAQARNFDRWHIMGKKIWPNVYAFGTYAQEVEYLKEFYSARLEWMDKAINSL